MGERPSGDRGGRHALFNHGVDLQPRIMERLGDMTEAARLENLCTPLAEGGKEICLIFLSKRDFIRSCTRSHAPVSGNNREAVIRCIRVGRDVMDPSRKRKFNGSVDRGSQRRHWERNGGNGTRNSEGQNHGNGAVFGGGRGVHYGGRDENNGGGGGARGGNGNNTTPPHQYRQKMRGGGQNCWEGGRLAYRERLIGGMGKHIFVRPCHRGAHSESMSLSAHRISVRP